MSLRLIIVDDEPLAREGVMQHLQKEILAGTVEVLAQCENGEQAVECIRRLSPDLVLLDINMPGLSGFDVVQRIGVQAMPMTIFLTAYDHFAVDAFRINALDYLLKPINARLFAESLGRAREQLARNQLFAHKEQLASLLQSLTGHAQTGSIPPPALPPRASHLLVRAAGHVYFLKPRDILWVAAEGDYVLIHARDRQHLVRESLRQMDERLAPEGFQRIHRSTLVNLDAIRELIANEHGDYQVVLKDGSVLRLSRNYRDQLYARLQDMA